MASIHQTPFAQEETWKALGAALRDLARQEIMSRFHHVQARRKADGSLVTEADRAMQRQVRRFLAERWPQYAFLGEESSGRGQRAALSGPGGCWILDPLDGTTNFIHGFEAFSCSLALSLEGEVVLGLVYDPIRDELFGARLRLGAELDGRPLKLAQPPATLDAALALVDYKRLPGALAAHLATDPPFASQRNLGTVALDWSWLAAGRADLYLHGAQKLWDYAAGLLIFSEAGGASCTLEGTPIPRRSIQPRSAVAAADARLLAAWCAAISRAGEASTT